MLLARIWVIGVVCSALGGCMVATATMAVGSAAAAVGGAAVSTVGAVGGAVVSGTSAVVRAVTPKGQGDDNRFSDDEKAQRDGVKPDAARDDRDARALAVSEGQAARETSNDASRDAQP